MEFLPVPNVHTGEIHTELGYANPGLIRRDARALVRAQAALHNLDVDALFSSIEAAGALFAEGELTVGGQTQSADDYIRAVSATTGIPEPLCALNTDKIRAACTEIRTSVSGLMGGLDPVVFDTGVSTSGQAYTRATGLGAVLPSNAPGVHALWVPAIAMKVPVALKPGGSEPWTPYRLAAALVAGGVPSEAISIYPTDHRGAEALLEHSERGMVFGHASTVAAHVDNDSISIHGPGYSKILVGDDGVDNLESLLDTIIASVLDNGGRSCINASTVIVPRQGQAVAQAIAERLGAVRARPLTDPAAQLAAFASRSAAEGMAQHISEQISGTAVDCSESYGDAVQESEGLIFMRPTVLWCPDPSHPLARSEYPFPFVSVVEMSPENAIDWMGDTLVLSALQCKSYIRDALSTSSSIDRLYMEGQKTTVVDWTRPYQDNLFELLYRQTSGAE